MIFTISVYPSKSIDGYFVAHCLEVDLIGEGDSPEKALIELMEAIKLQIEACKGTGGSFYFPAPAQTR